MPSVDNTIQTVTAPVGLTTTEASVVGATGIPLAESPGPARGTPFALAFVYIPNITGNAAGASVTVNLRNGTTIAAPIIGSCTVTNTGAGAAAVGGVLAVALVPPGCENLFIGAVASSGTPSAAASATAPIIAGVLYLT